MPDTNPKPAGKGDAKPPWRDPARLMFLANNVLSMLGFILVGGGLILLVTFALFGIVSPSVNPYFGIVGYVMLPGIFITGLIIVPVGMLIKHWRVLRRLRAHPGEAAYPRIDLNNRKTRWWILGFMTFSWFVVLPVLGVSSYYGYHWTESTAFCGRLCHTVMQPQDVGHDRSPHARVECATCHIGPGASWFVKSKITGLGQVVAVLRDDYPRPIPNAITNLRPAQVTCEQCHWPAQFFGWQYRKTSRYVPDEENKLVVVRMMLKTGGANEETGQVEGIHRHMLMTGRLQYVAIDPDLQQIPWVRHTLPDGEVLIYRSDGKPSDAPRPAGLVRNVDCMDCHNRAAHLFEPPEDALDLYLSTGAIASDLPYIKREAVTALIASYSDRQQSLDAIQHHLTDFYQKNYPQVWENKQPKINEAITTVQKVYKDNFFPYMREDWRTYPNNVGHKGSAGCFRCHDGLHVDQNGNAISSRCSTCHVFLNPAETKPDTFTEGEFHHPMDLAAHRRLRCDQCHTGGRLLLCADCHTTGNWLAQRGKTEFRYEGE